MKAEALDNKEASRKARRPRRVLMFLENHFPEDVRVRQEAYKLIEAGYQVTIIAQFSEEGTKAREVINGVVVYRIPLITIFSKTAKRPDKDSRFATLHLTLFRIRSAIGYVFEYFYFTTACFVMSLVVAARGGFDVIHLHNPPNTPFIVGFFFKLFGKRFVFDHHDLAPELYLSRYRIPSGFIHAILLLEEKLCLRAANMVITTNESYKEIDIERGKKDPGSVFVVRNGPDLRDRIFQTVPPDPELKAMGKHILVYIGVMGPQDGVDYLLRSIWSLVHNFHREDFYCLIIGHGDELENLKHLAAELKLEKYVRFTDFIPKSDLIRYLSTSDICLDPNPSNPLNDYSTWVKVLEYMAFGKPIVSFDLKETRFSAGDAAVYARANDEDDYARKIIHLMDHPEERDVRGASGNKRMREVLAWQHVSRNLVEGYDFLFSRKDGRGK